MSDFAVRFPEKLNAISWKHSDPTRLANGQYVMESGVNGKYGTYRLIFVYSEDGSVFGIRSHGLPKIPDEKYYETLKLMNELNATYRWTKLYIGKDKTATAQLDADLSLEGSEEIAVRMIGLFLKVCDEYYPQLMRTIWSDQ